MLYIQPHVLLGQDVIHPWRDALALAVFTKRSGTLPMRLFVNYDDSYFLDLPSCEPRTSGRVKRFIERITEVINLFRTIGTLDDRIQEFSMSMLGSVIFSVKSFSD